MHATALTDNAINLLKRPKNIKIPFRNFPQKSKIQKWQIWGALYFQIAKNIMLHMSYMSFMVPKLTNHASLIMYMLLFFSLFTLSGAPLSLNHIPCLSSVVDPSKSIKNMNEIYIMRFGVV